MRVHKISNVNKALDFIASKGVKLVSIGAEGEPRRPDPSASRYHGDTAPCSFMRRLFQSDAALLASVFWSQRLTL